MQLIDRRTDQAASAASSPVDRIAKALAYLSSRADIEPSEFAALLAQHSGPREGVPSVDEIEALLPVQNDDEDSARVS